MAGSDRKQVELRRYEVARAEALGEWVNYLLDEKCNSQYIAKLLSKKVSALNNKTWTGATVPEGALDSDIQQQQHEEMKAMSKDRKKVRHCQRRHDRKLKYAFIEGQH